MTSDDLEAPTDRGRGRLARVAAVVRDGWLMLGIALVLLVALEVAYRSQANLRRALRDEPRVRVPSGHPYESQAWWTEWSLGEGAWRNRYDPYRATWPRPQVGRYLNIDSAGRRQTVQPGLDSAGSTRRVYLLGGSTMFGYTTRDEWTIPSQMADLLLEAGIQDVQVVNLGQSTFNITQGLITLALELRAGRVPDAVAFLDGNNEVAPAFQSGRPGTVLNEDLIAAEVRSTPPPVISRIATSFSFIQRLGRAVGLDGPPEPRVAAPAADEICPGVAETYLGAVSVIEGLGTAFGFDVVFFWQPMLATTAKDLTPFERSVRAEGTWGQTVRECTNEVVRQAESHAVGRFVPLTDLFDGDTATVFIDDYGHVTEIANRQIAGAMLESVLPLVVNR